MVGRMKESNEAAWESIESDNKNSEIDKEHLSQSFINLDDEFDHKLKAKMGRINESNETARDEFDRELSVEVGRIKELNGNNKRIKWRYKW